MCKVGCAATLGPTYAIKSFLRCQSRQRRVVVNTLGFCVSPLRNFAANRLPHKRRAAIILMSFKLFSVQRPDRKTNPGRGSGGNGLLASFSTVQIRLETFLVWLKERNLQMNRLPPIRAAGLDCHGARLGLWMTVGVLHRWQRHPASPDPHSRRCLLSVSLYFLAIVLPSSSTCSTVEWTTLNLITGTPLRPSPASLPGTDPSEGQSSCTPPHRRSSLIPTRARRCGGGPSWGSAKGRSLSNDG